MTVATKHCLSHLFSLALLLLVSVVGNSALAGDVEGLYEVDRLVVGQDAKERNVALAEALGILIERVGGKKDIVEVSGLTPILKSAKDYVERFEYIPLENIPVESTPTQAKGPANNSPDTTGQEPAAPVYHYRLHVLFDKASVERLLDAHQVPIWGRLRPTLVVWLAIDDGTHRYTVAPDNADGLEKTLAEVGTRRGLPIILPLMDLEEQARIGFSDIWGDFADTIRTASSRYRAGAELVGRAYRQDGAWSLRWSLYSESQADHWEGGAASLDTGLTEALDRAADHLGDLYARAAGQAEDKRVEMEVSDVADISGYARLLAYLQSLELISDVVVTKVQADQVTFDLRLKQESSFLRRAIEFDDTLAPAPAADTGVIMSNGSKDILRYRLLQ